MELSGTGRATGFVLAGFLLAVIGSLTLLFATVVVHVGPYSIGRNLGSPPGNYSVPVASPVGLLLLVAILALPLLFALLDKSFRLWTSIGPAVVFFFVIAWMRISQFSSNVELSSELWIFVGDALVLLGCGFEILGVTVGQARRRSVVTDPPTSDTGSSPSGASHPR